MTLTNLMPTAFVPNALVSTGLALPVPGQTHPHYCEEYCGPQYNARAMIDDHPAIFARWARNGERARRAGHAQIDLRYGKADGERLDYFPAAAPTAPLLVFIHGGFWRSLDKSDFSWLAAPFNAAGVAVALVNYDLAPTIPLEGIVRQNLRATDWLWHNAARLGFDRERMIVSGHSAGAHLAAMLLTAHWPDWSGDLPGVVYKGGILLSGIYDLEPLMHAHFINVDLHLTPERVAMLSPLHMTPASNAPVMTAVGGMESDEFKRQTATLAATWANAHREEAPVPDANHLTICDRLAEPGHDLFEAALKICLGDGQAV